MSHQRLAKNRQDSTCIFWRHNIESLLHSPQDLKFCTFENFYIRIFNRYRRFSGVNLIKLFLEQIYVLFFCKIDLFITVQQILLMFIKWCSLQKE